MDGSPERGSPQEPSYLAAAEVQGGFDETAKLPTRLERYATARARALETLAHLEAVTQGADYNPMQQAILSRKAKGLKACGEFLHFRDYITAGKVRLHAANFCKAHLLCPLCGIRRCAKSLDAYLKRYKFIMGEKPHLQAAMLTLTVKDGPDLLERFEHLRRIVATLLDRRSQARRGRNMVTEWVKIEGLVGSYEFKRGENSGEWHPHVHMAILYSGRLDFVAMREEYKRISGDSHVFRVDQFKHPGEPEKDFVEVFKYSVAFQELEPDDLISAFLALSGRRLLFSAGAFWGVVIPESLCDEPLDGLPFVDLFYRFGKGGYSLLASRVDGQITFSDLDQDEECLTAFNAIKGADTRTIRKPRRKPA